MRVCRQRRWVADHISLDQWSLLRTGPTSTLSLTRRSFRDLAISWYDKKGYSVVADQVQVTACEVSGGRRLIHKRLVTTRLGAS